MAVKKGKTMSTETNTGSAEYKPEQSADSSQLVDLLTKVLKTVQKQVEVESKPKNEAMQKIVEHLNSSAKVLKQVQEQVKVEPKQELDGRAEQAIDEYKKISLALRVPTQRNKNIVTPKWKLPPVNPRARQKT
jgi:hypothetical protein